MRHYNPYIEPLLVDVPTACAMLSIKRTKCFGLMNDEGPKGLSRIKIGRKTLVTLDSVQRLAGQQQDWRHASSDAAEAPNERSNVS